MEVALTALDVTQATGLVAIGQRQLAEMRQKDLPHLSENTELVKDKATEAEEKFRPVELSGIGTLVLRANEVIETVPAMETCLDDALGHLTAFNEVMKRYQELRHSAEQSKNRSQALQQQALSFMDNTIEHFKGL
jgi:hypothetical protein